MRRAEARAKMKIGLPLGMPIKCQLGKLTEDRFCPNDAVASINKIRICQHHLLLLADVKAEADPDFEARHPMASGFLRMAP